MLLRLSSKGGILATGIVHGINSIFVLYSVIWTKETFCINCENFIPAHLGIDKDNFMKPNIQY